MPERSAREKRVLVLAPTGRDAVLACQLLSSMDVLSQACSSPEDLFRQIMAGAGAVVIADEALQPHTTAGLLEVLASQPPWSDLPLLVFTRGESSEHILELLAPLGNATLLERPVRLSTLASAVKAALRARRRQYEVRDLLERQAEADRRKDEFLAMLGHELRNPMAAIRNALWVLDQVGSKDEQAIRQRETIQRQTRHLVRMVDDLLDVSRVTLGKIILKRHAVDLREVAERCLTDLGMASLAAGKGLTLTVETQSVTVLGDPVRLEQVLCNLLQNAIKYTPQGGHLTISVQTEGAEGVVRVKDTGIGLSPEMLQTIFEPFAQVESSRQRSEGGLGLGLPLVRSLVALHGGRVEALSAGPARGSEFIVHFPLLRVEEKPRSLVRKPAPAARVPQDPGVGLHLLHVLVVEDNHDGRESLRDLLEIWGHEVTLAEDGPEGVDKALSVHPDVALVDIGLPGLDGNEVARRIRSALGSDEISLIAMTGYGQPEDRRRALQAGFDRYLVKPVDPAILSQLLAEMSIRGESRAGETSVA
ncbi:MAG TPA: ATP-binding protein [Thermoanaerobaculia bacterium]|nr:ATP-binding protein [Thermoanaerobaculia bacterium]